MKITKIKISNFRGIAELETSVPPGGAIVKGSNGQAKTSVIRAIQAALAARDIGPEAIRLGEDRAEILVDLDAVEVRRTITHRGTKLEVSKDIGDGLRAKVPSPKDHLRGLLGTSAIDPIELVTERDRKKRRSQILAALPVRVTAEQIREWTGETATIDPEMHGLEVVSGLRAAYYDRRRDANACAKELHARAQAVCARASAQPAPPDPLPSLEHATAVADEARTRVAQLEAQARTAQAAEARNATTRAKIEDLRRRASAEIAGLTDPPADVLERAERGVAEWRERVAELEAELSEARKGLSAAELYASQTRANVERVATARRRSESFLEQASGLESAISLAAVQPPDPAELSEASERLSSALSSLEVARNAQTMAIAYRALADEREAAEKAAATVQAEADRLDGIVQRLTDAPAQLLASSDGIRGLTLEGDDVFLDGVNLDGLCGLEQLRFAVEVARRSNGPSKILLVDGLERIAPEHIDEFVRMATADGWQLLATMVADGARVFAEIQC